jgi:hypothetical protein
MPRKKPSKPQGATARQSPAFWRVSTLIKENIERAIQAKQWGTPRGIGMRTVKPGDKVAFYVSGWSRDAGYWGTAKVTSERFVSHTEVWFDDIYPVRFKILAEGPLVSKAVSSEAVKARLGGRRLMFMRQAGVISLTAAEYAAIADLLARARRDRG